MWNEIEDVPDEDILERRVCPYCGGAGGYEESEDLESWDNFIGCPDCEGWGYLDDDND